MFFSNRPFFFIFGTFKETIYCTKLKLLFAFVIVTMSSLTFLPTSNTQIKLPTRRHKGVPGTRSETVSVLKGIHHTGFFSSPMKSSRGVVCLQRGRRHI